MTRTVQVLSSNGTDHYAVTVDQEGKATACPCAGFTNRQKCRHLGRAEELATDPVRFTEDPPEPKAEVHRKREMPD